MVYRRARHGALLRIAISCRAQVSFETGKTLRVVLRATNADLEQVNVLHYDLNDSNDLQDQDPQALADFFRDNVVQHIQPLLAASWSIQPVLVQQELDPQNPFDPRQEWTSGGVLGGTKAAVGDYLPPGVAVLYRLQSDHIGRRYNGRLWAIGTESEGDQADGIWSSSYLDGVNFYVNAIPKQPDIGPPGSLNKCNWSVYSRTNRAANVPTYLAHVQAAIVRTKVHYLRSRSN